MTYEAQIDVARHQIESVSAGSYRGFTKRKDDRLLIEWHREEDWSDGKEGTSLKSWEQRDDRERRHVMETHVPWKGIAEDDKRWLVEQAIDVANQKDERMHQVRIVEQIKVLQSATFEVTLDGVETRVSWHELSNGAQDDLLARTVDWTGLATDDRSDVVMRVLKGHAPERWMDGVRIERIAERFEAMGLDAVSRVERAESAAREVEWVKSMSFILEEGKAPEPCSDCFLPWWEELNREEQRAALIEHVDWSGIEDRRDGMIAAALHPDSPERLKRQADEYFGRGEMDARDVAGPPWPPQGWEEVETMPSQLWTQRNTAVAYDRLLTLAAARRPANDNERGIDR